MEKAKELAFLLCVIVLAAYGSMYNIGEFYMSTYFVAWPKLIVMFLYPVVLAIALYLLSKCTFNIVILLCYSLLAAVTFFTTFKVYSVLNFYMITLLFYLIFLMIENIVRGVHSK